MSPLLILASVPTSNTGVFPDTVLSSRGPNCGRSNPNFAVSPSIILDTISSSPSTTLMGSHFSNHIDSPNVDFPSISFGRTCTFTTFHKFVIKILITWYGLILLPSSRQVFSLLETMLLEVKQTKIHNLWFSHSCEYQESESWSKIFCLFIFYISVTFSLYFLSWIHRLKLVHY